MTFAPRTWVVGEVVTGALMNTEIRDQFNSMFAAWTAYTPTWTGATTNPAIGNGSIVGRYIKIGRTVTAEVILTMGSTTTYGSGSQEIGVPVTAAAAIVSYLGTARFTGASTWLGQTYLILGNNTMQVTFPASASATTGASMSPTVPETQSNGDILRAAITYQSAS